MPWRLSQASGFRQQGNYNRTSAAERSEIRREAVRLLLLQDAPPCPSLAHPEFHSKSSFVCFPAPSHQPMQIHRVIPEEPKKEAMCYYEVLSKALADCQNADRKSTRLNSSHRCISYA